MYKIVQQQITRKIEQLKLKSFLIVNEEDVVRLFTQRELPAIGYLLSPTGGDSGDIRKDAGSVLLFIAIKTKYDGFEHATAIDLCTNIAKSIFQGSQYTNGGIDFDSDNFLDDTTSDILFLLTARTNINV